MRLYDNCSARNTVWNGFSTLAHQAKQLHIAVPFFTLFDPILTALGNGCEIRLIVRLCEATSASALAKVFDKGRILIRYYTSELFHSKLYIFDNKELLLGSANMTDSGFKSNREVAVHLSDPAAVSEAEIIFSTYWSHAAPLDTAALNKFCGITRRNAGKRVDAFATDIEKAFGDITPKSFRESEAQDPMDIALLDYRRQFQEVNLYLDELKNVFIQHKVKTLDISVIPLRISIDNFLNFIRDKYTNKNSYLDGPLRDKNSRESFIVPLAHEWSSSWNTFYTETIPNSYRTINTFFDSETTTKAANWQDIVSMLECCHAFHDRLRFFTGGLEALKQEFMNTNELRKVCSTFRYLIFGKDDYITRMCKCIYDPKVKLNEFGRSGVQELHGWANRDDVPICNSRTIKSLRFLGYDVEEW